MDGRVGAYIRRRRRRLAFVLVGVVLALLLAVALSRNDETAESTSRMPVLSAKELERALELQIENMTIPFPRVDQAQWDAWLQARDCTSARDDARSDGRIEDGEAERIELACGAH